MRIWREGIRRTMRRLNTGLPDETLGFEEFKDRHSEDGAETVREALTAVQSWVEAVRLGEIEYPWLTILGVPGTGKTHLLQAAVYDLALDFQTEYQDFILYRTELEYLSDLHLALDQGEGEKRFRQFCTIPVLVFDDVGAGISTTWERTRVEALVDCRYRHRLPTLISSNYTLAEMSGEGLRLARTASRLGDVEIGRVVRLKVTDYRRRPRNRKGARDEQTEGPHRDGEADRGGYHKTAGSSC